MAIAGLAGHFDPQIGATSVDFIPDVGHGEIGVNPNADLPWLSLNPKTGNIIAGNSDLITARFDSEDLEINRLYRGYIVVYSNDPKEPVSSIPVILNTGKPINVEIENEVPQGFSLKQNYPNPFNPSTIIPFSINKSGNAVLKIYNIIGQEIITLLNENLSTGSYEIKWNGTDNNGTDVSSGVYFYTLEQSDKKVTRKLILNR
jgi:hypothetical protein